MSTAVPKDVDLKVLEKQLLSLPGVQMVHNLHVWALTLDTHVLNAHLAVGKTIHMTFTAPKII